MQEPAEEEGKEETAVLYTCPSAGAQIVTTETTAATSCLYCHSPVVLEGRLQGEFHPDRVIPFAFTREEAERRFYEWVAKKRYVPKGYFDTGKTEYFMGFTTPTGCWTAIHRQTTQPMQSGPCLPGQPQMSTPKPLFTASIAREICILWI